MNEDNYVLHLPEGITLEDLELMAEFEEFIEEEAA